MYYDEAVVALIEKNWVSNNGEGKENRKEVRFLLILFKFHANTKGIMD